MTAKTWIKNTRYASKQCFCPKDLNFYLFSIHPLLEPSTSLSLTISSIVSRPTKTKVRSSKLPQSPSWLASRCHFFKKDKVNIPLRIWAKHVLEQAVWDSNLGLIAPDSTCWLRAFRDRCQELLKKDLQQSLKDVSEKYSNENHQTTLFVPFKNTHRYYCRKHF